LIKDLKQLSLQSLNLGLLIKRQLKQLPYTEEYDKFIIYPCTGHATRARDNIYVSAQNMVLSNSNPYCSMASLYNYLPGRVKDIKNLKEYVKALKEFVMDKKFYCFDDFLKCI
jgi:hypothetical protein